MVDDPGSLLAALLIYLALLGAVALAFLVVATYALIVPMDFLIVLLYVVSTGRIWQGMALAALLVAGQGIEPLPLFLYRLLVVAVFIFFF